MTESKVDLYRGRNSLADDAFKQFRLASDDLIKNMNVFQQTLDAQVNQLVGQTRGDQVISHVDAKFQAMKTQPVQEAVANCHWATERVNTFALMYQTALTREQERIARRSAKWSQPVETVDLSGPYSDL